MASAEVGCGRSVHAVDAGVGRDGIAGDQSDGARGEADGGVADSAHSDALPGRWVERRTILVRG